MLAKQPARCRDHALLAVGLFWHVAHHTYFLTRHESSCSVAIITKYDDRHNKELEMPIYQCYSPKGLLTKSAKAKIADEMTSLYCNVTGAPASSSKSSIPRDARRRVLLGRQTGIAILDSRHQPPRT